MTPSCPACLTAGGARHVAREMMFGTGEEFGYVECPGCGCLYIEAVPEDLARHYPADYYSLAPPAQSGVVRWLKRARGRHALGDRNVVGAVMQRLLGAPDYAVWGRVAGITRDASILDMGAGGGERLSNMAGAGYRRVMGTEPYQRAERVETADGVVVYRELPEELAGGFDLVMMHHAFEHVPDAVAQLRTIWSLLAPGGCALLRVPVMGTYAWRTFGVDWVQLDAPRHLILHTEASLAALAARTGFTVESSYFDSGSMQVWGSELYAAGVPLTERGPWRKAQGYTRGRPKLLALDRLARRLNRERDGDQAAFVLRRLETAPAA